MKVSPHVSTYSMFNAVRNATASMQTDLVRLQQEVVTGKLTDSGLVLGARSENLASFKSDIADLERIMDTNGVTASRLDMTQTALGQLNSISDDLVNTLGLSLGDEAQKNVVLTESQNAIEQITSLLNTQVNGVHIFGGVNSASAPIAAHTGGTGEAAFDAAFSGHFGFAKTAPAAAGITAAQMTDFLENVLEPQFMGAGWTTDYSSATDETINARIGVNTVASASVSANEDGFRKLMLGAVVAKELYAAPLSQEARDSAALFAMSSAKGGGTDITGLESSVGLMENRIDRQNKTMTSQVDVLTRLSDNLEGVDQFEASTALTNLLTQIEASYATTARIQQMSIMRYL